MTTNIKNNISKKQMVSIISITATPIENWASNWDRHGKLQLLNHPKTSVDHLVSKTIREAHDGERFLKDDCWEKVHRHFPSIEQSFFEEVFHDLLRQVYSNLKYDLYYYRTK